MKLRRVIPILLAIVICLTAAAPGLSQPPVTVSAAAGAPTLASITTAKQSYLVNETITFQFSTDGSTNTLWIYRADGQWQNHYQNVGTSYSLAFGWAGEYEALVETWNGNGSKCSERITFFVGAPSYANLSANRTSVAPGASISFNASSDGNWNDLWIYHPNGRKEYVQNISSVHSMRFDVPGTYRAQLEAWNSIGYTRSPEVTFTVSPTNYPTQAELSLSKSSYAVNESVTFSIGANGTSTKLVVARVDGAWSNTYQNVGSTYTMAFGWAGAYTAHIETTNATGTTKSPSVEFVIGKPTYAYVGVSQQEVNAGSPMVFSCAGNGSSNTLWLYRKDGQWQTHYSDVGPTFSLAFGWAGEYEALVETWNGSGSCQSQRISFTVNAVSEPTVATISVPKTSFASGEGVTFTTASNGSSNTLWIYYPDGSSQHFADVDETFCIPLTESGSYSALIQAWNGTGSCTSQKVFFTVEGTAFTPTVPTADTSGNFTVAQNGAPKATVVISANPSRKVLDAASDLIAHVKKISGATLDLTTDTGTMDSNRFYILVGPSSFTQQKGVSQPTGYPNNEKLIVKRVGNCLVLLGNDDGAFTGTQFAVTRFLEELGCGWYGTDALWQVIPDSPTISFAGMDIVETPKFISRGTNRLNSGVFEELAQRWYMGGVEVATGQHYLMSYVGNSHQTAHPEWYAKKADGSQLYPLGDTAAWPDIYWQFCYSNTGLRQKVAETVMNYFASNPNCMVFSITPNDGWEFGTCQCAACACYANDTDLILAFGNAVAAIVKQTYPDRYVSVLTYHTTLTAPSSARPVDSNLDITFCAETSMTSPVSTASYIGMSGAKQNIAWRDNFLKYISRTGVKQRSAWKWLCIAAENPAWSNIPWVQGNVATDDHTFWKNHGVSYVFYDQGPLTAYYEYESSLPLRWPLWYVANKGCWDQTSTGEELLAEACKKLYGNGWDEMLAYYIALADASEACTADSYAWVAPDPAAVYTPQQIMNIDAKAAAAEAVVSQVSAVEAERMENQIQLWETAKEFIN